jgi:hypothetical protein
MSNNIVKNEEEAGKTESSGVDSNSKIELHNLRTIAIYQVLGLELDAIERGSPDSIYLNFAIGLLSAAISFSIALCTVDFENKNKVYITFLVFCVLFGISGMVLLLVWYKNRSNFKAIIKRIRTR